MKLKLILGFALTIVTFIFWGERTLQKWTSPAFGQSSDPTIPRNVASDITPEIRASLVVGSDVAVPISKFANRILQGGSDNSKFVAAQPSDNLPVSAKLALDIANSSTLAMLTQAPIKTTVEYLLYTNPTDNIQNKPVWRVIFWGSPIRMNPPPVLEQGRFVQRPIVQSKSCRAVTYLLIDPFDPKAEYIEQSSAGPND
ncbi:hypothetical protein [uncultured Nostoc sp.]|uniref:hypothetical protein n=1 Tax=uncultured Nostoc sp. TaxID=340711 RepID=UPI0035CB813D